MWRIVVVTAVSPVGPVPFPGKENNARSRTLMSDDDLPLPHLHLAGVQVASFSFNLRRLGLISH
jgi:hypothetical protein